MITMLFGILVVVGFLFWLLASAGVGSRSELIARALWFAAAIVWFISNYQGH